MVLIFFLAAVAATSPVAAQGTNLEGFKISVENRENTIHLKGIEGTAWAKLSFATAGEKQYAINQFGVMKLSEARTSKKSNLPSFLFAVIKTEEGVTLRGYEGTAWSSLSFDLAPNESKAINELGMVSNSR